MSCAVESETTNVFRSSILVPLMKILNVYTKNKRTLSPDEFCIVLFTRKNVDEKCKFGADPVVCVKDLKDFESTPESTQSIIAELFMSIIRYEFVLETASKRFLNERNCHEDLHEIMVHMYILIYRIDHLSFEDSVECFIHFKLTKIISLVSYLLRAETMNLIHKTGCLIFEEEFVEQKLIFPYLEAIPFLENLHIRLVEEKRKRAVAKKEATVPVFMNVLNHPKVSRVPPPTPEDLTTMKFARQVPKSNYLKPTTETRLASLRAANKLQALSLLNDANEKAPSCSRPRNDRSKSTKETEQVTTVHVRKSPPIFKPVEVRQTAASVLRECARIVRKETEEVEKLKKLAEGGHDTSAIVKLEEEWRRQEREEERKRVQEKHLSGLLTREGAFIAKQSVLNSLKIHGVNVRKEKQELYERLEKWRQKHDKGMMEVVEKCREVEQASRDAFNSMIDEKRQKAAEVSAESRQLRRLLAEQKEEETQKKVRLIQEIKTIQSLRSLAFKDFDPTETSGLGLMCEMSLAELKERLFWIKMKLNEEVENRKTNIHRERERQKNLIKDTQKALEEYKASKRGITSKIQQQCTAVNSPEIEALRKKLEERRAMRLQK